MQDIESSATMDSNRRNEPVTDTSLAVINRLRTSIYAGRPWYPALLDAIHDWTATEEVIGETQYSYLIEGEAFDWLMLADRLLAEVSDLVPEEERADLVLFDSPPVELDRDEFRQSIGAAKYRAFLNYLYGVLSEEALLLSTVDEVRKELRGQGITDESSAVDTAYVRLYGDTENTLMAEYKREKKHGQRRFLTLGELHEFRYWLFKRRVNRSEPARLASDTTRAMTRIRRDAEARSRKARASRSQHHH